MTFLMKNDLNHKQYVQLLNFLGFSFKHSAYTFIDTEPFYFWNSTTGW